MEADIWVGVEVVMVDAVVDMVMALQHTNGNSNSKAKPNASRVYPPAEWNKLSFKECNKICKEHDKKGDQGGMKWTIGNISVEHVTTIISAVHQAQRAVTMDDTELTPSTSAGNAFGRKANTKKMHAIEWLSVGLANSSSSLSHCLLAAH